MKNRWRVLYEVVRAILVLCAFVCLVGTLAESWMIARSVRRSSAEAADGLRESSKLLNASLIQAGITLSRVERASRGSEEYWEQIKSQSSVTMRKSQETLDRLSASAESLQALVSRTDASLNDVLVPSMSRSLESSAYVLSSTAESLSRDVSSVSLEAVSLARASSDVVAKAGDVLGGDEVRSILENTEKTSENVVGITQNVEDGTEYVADALKPTKKSFLRTLLYLLIPRPVIKMGGS